MDRIIISSGYHSNHATKQTGLVFQLRTSSEEWSNTWVSDQPYGRLWLSTFNNLLAGINDMEVQSANLCLVCGQPQIKLMAEKIQRVLCECLATRLYQMDEVQHTVLKHSKYREIANNSLYAEVVSRLIAMSVGPKQFKFEVAAKPSKTTYQIYEQAKLAVT